MELYPARFLYGLLIRLMLAPVPLALLLVPKESRESKLFGLVALVTWLAWYLGGRWLAAKAARHHVIERREFHQAFRDALSDARLALSFLPVVGRFFLSRNESDREI